MSLIRDDRDDATIAARMVAMRPIPNNAPLSRINDMTMEELGQIRRIIARIDQIDRVRANQAETRDLSVMTYRQMQRLSPKLNRDPAIYPRMVQIEEAAARRLGMSRTELLQSPNRTEACEQVANTLAGRDNARSIAVTALKTLLTRTSNREAAATLIEMYQGDTKPAFTPMEQGTVVVQRRGYSI